jgi:hypothetical protein
MFAPPAAAMAEEKSLKLRPRKRKLNNLEIGTGAIMIKRGVDCG